MREVVGRTVFAAGLVLLISGCAPTAGQGYAGWVTYEAPAKRFRLRYPSPPWTLCTGTEFEEGCHECPGHLIGANRCGGADRWVAVWIPPAILDPELLLFPAYKLEISWFRGDFTVLELAQAEERVITRAGMDVRRSSGGVTMVDGTLGAELAYEGASAQLNDDSPLLHPDARQYRVVYVTDDGWAYRLGLDTGIDMDLPEVSALLASFALGVESESER